MQIENLITGLELIRSYKIPKYPIEVTFERYEREPILFVWGLDPQVVAQSHINKLKRLGFAVRENQFVVYC